MEITSSNTVEWKNSCNKPPSSKIHNPANNLKEQLS